MSVAELQRQVAALSAERAELQRQLDEAKTTAEPPFPTEDGQAARTIAARNGELRELRWKARELVESQASLERERSELKRRAMAAEEQLAEMQRFLPQHIGKYQKEIVRLRESLKARG